MLPPASQNYFGQLANLGLQLSRMAGLPDLSVAVQTAREALNLLKQEPVTSAHPQVPGSVVAIETRLSEESNAVHLRQALGELSRLIQSLGTAAPRAFLFLIQNAPDQQGPQSEVRPVTPQGGLRKTGLLETLIGHWERGEHPQARTLLTSIAWSARDGKAHCLRELGRVVTSDHKTLSTNAHAVAEAIESLGWNEFVLKFIDPTYPFLIPGFDAERRNPWLLIRFLGNPPATSEAVAALQSHLRVRPQKDLRGFRKHAAQGLFALTSPAYDATLSVHDFWKTVIQAWPLPLPVLSPSFFGPTRQLGHRWDLFEEHLQSAFEIAENAAQPIGLRREALAAVWKGYSGTESAPRPLWTVAYFRTRELVAKEADMAWAGELLRTYEKDAGLDVPDANADVPPPLPEPSPAEVPLRLMGQFASFTRSRVRHLRLVSGDTAVFGELPLENLEKLTKTAEALGTYGLHLEAPLVSGVMKAAMEELIVDPVFDPKASLAAVETFRRAVYPLNPAAAVTAWMEATGLEWPSYRLERGHRVEGALALLRWIRDREREPEELKKETARRYWNLSGRFSPAAWTPVRPDVDAWWQHRLTQELPAALASQLSDAQLMGAPRGWTEYLRQHPDAEADLYTFSQSNLPGTRLLAGRILRILSL